MDSNTNLPSYSGDISKYIGRTLGRGEIEDINRSLGLDPSRSNYNFIYGGNVYRVGGAAGEANTVTQVDSVARRMGQQAEEKQKEAIKPIVASLEATKPEITSKYNLARNQLQASEQPLKDRYQTLLDSINTQKTSDVSAQTRVTNSELAKRGITNDSTLAQQEVLNATQPLNERYTNLSTQTGLEREDSLRSLQDSIANLTPQETADLRAISDAIAQIQANSAQTGIAQSLDLYSRGLDNQLAQQELGERQKQNAIANALAQAKFDFEKSSSSSGSNYDNFIKLNEGDTLFDLSKLQSIFNVPKTYKSTSGSSGW